MAYNQEKIHWKVVVFVVAEITDSSHAKQIEIAKTNKRSILSTLDFKNKYQQQVFKIQDAYNNFKSKNIFGKFVLSREMYHG